MKKAIKWTIFIGIALILIIFIGYSLYGSNKSFQDIISKNYANDTIKKISVQYSYNQKDNLNQQYLTDKTQINKLLNYLEPLELKEYKGKIDSEHYIYYNLGLHTDKNGLLGVTIYNKDFVTIFISTSNDTKTYKIVNNNFDVYYLKDLVENNKDTK